MEGGRAGVDRTVEPMDTQTFRARPRATSQLSPALPGERMRRRRASLVAGGVFAIAGALVACTSPGSSGINVPSPLPSVDVSAVASAASAAASVAAQAAMTALDQVDTAIQANQSSGNLTADDASSLTQLSSGLRTALQSGDMTSAKTALDNLSTKVDSFAAKLNGDAGTQLKNAIAAVKAAMPTS
jgi:hypothetical protein